MSPNNCGHRLGVLGYIPPSLAPSSGDPNLGLLDVINGLNAVQSYVSFAGGDKSKVTIGGQSSGAQVIRGTRAFITIKWTLTNSQVYGEPPRQRACSGLPFCNLTRW